MSGAPSSNGVVTANGPYEARDARRGVAAVGRAAPHPRTVRLVATAVAVLVAVSAAVTAGAAIGDGGSKAEVVIPIGLALGLALAGLAAARFDLFVATVLVLRASLDVAKLGTSSIDAPGAISGLFIVAGLLWLVSKRSQDAAVEKSPLVAPVVALVVAGALSTIFSPVPFTSAVETVRIATVAVILAVLNRLLVDWRHIRLILIAVFASSIVPVGIGVYQVVHGLGRSLRTGLTRIDGTFVHPNPFAFYLFLLIVLGVALYPYLYNRARRVMLVALMAWGGLLLMTYARGALIAAIVGMFVIGAIRDKRWIPVIAVCLLALYLFVPSLTTRFDDLSRTTTPSGAAGNSLEWRLRYWGETLALAKNPAFGIGLKAVETETTAERQPHNDFLRVYIETGLVGLAAYLWFIWSLAAAARRTRESTRGGPARALALAFTASVIGFVLLSATGNIISQLVILWYFGAIASAAIAAARLNVSGADEDFEPSLTAARV